MNIGDYVRTPQGIIAKIINIQEDTGQYFLNGNAVSLESKNYIADKNITIGENFKHSPNIIDLFEEHDLVVIEYYSLRYNERVTRLFEVTFKDGEYINLSNAKCEFMLVNGEFNKGDKELKPIIKSILTKEQFESMEYKVGE